MQSVSYDLHAEVRGVVLGTFRELTCFGNALSKILLKHGIDLDDPREWYPVQDWLAVKKEIHDTFGPATLFFIGLNVIADVKWPPQIDTLEKGLFSINEAYYMNHRGGHIGSYETRKIDDATYTVTCCNPYPSYFDLGIIRGVCNKFCKENCRVHVSLDKEKPTRRDGAGCCTYVVRLMEYADEGDEPWINNEVLLIHAVLKEAFDVMNNMSNELESAWRRSDALNRQLEIANEQLSQLATIDELTQVPNRRLFNVHLKQEWHASQRSGKKLSLILCDIDDFKQLNDRYGHQKGDECLQHIARAIKNALRRPRDLVARFGGEEFAVILPDTDNRSAVKVAEEIRANILSLAGASEATAVTLSFGVATLEESISSIEELIGCADGALYEAKASGKNCIIVD